MSRRIIVFLLLSVSTAFCLAYWPFAPERTPQYPRAVTLTGGPMLQRGNTDGTTSIAVVWRTAEKAAGRVEYGPTPELGSRAADTALTEYHAVVLDKLQPSKEYHYRVLSGDRTLAQASFRTGKTAEQAFRFAVFGDSGSGKKGQYRLAEQIDKHKVDLILHTGDVVYFQGEDEFYREKFYQPYQSLLRSIPIFPVFGKPRLHHGPMMNLVSGWWTLADPG
jgi:Purple acid Phosphatase, N-terminal domain/Calcineurin-like phosphoesterase